MTEPEIRAALAAPFAAEAIHWKAQTVKDNRCLAVPYLSARDVIDRLNETLGLDGWEDRYKVLDEKGNVECSLTLHFGGRGVTRCDVGGESEQPDDGDKCKAAYSDALKRAAVKFGVGRYLYSLPKVWTDYDRERKQIKSTPTLPAWARPADARPLKDAKPAAPEGNGKPTPAPAEPVSEKTVDAVIVQMKKLTTLAALKVFIKGLATAGMTDAQKARIAAAKDDHKAALQKKTEAAAAG